MVFRGKFERNAKDMVSSLYRVRKMAIKSIFVLMCKLCLAYCPEDAEIYMCSKYKLVAMLKKNIREACAHSSLSGKINYF